MTAVRSFAAAALLLTGVLAMSASAGESKPAEKKEPAGKVVFQDGFDKDLDNWVVEKWEDDAVQVSKHDGQLKVATQSKLHGTMIWCKQALPKNFRIDFDFTPTSASGFFLLFFCVKGQNGKAPVDPELLKARNEETLFKKYVKGTIDGYHISYRRNEAANVNLRKNSGLNLLKQQILEHPLPKDKTVKVRLTKNGGQIKLEVDGAVFMDFTDKEQPWEGGHFGLRQVYESEGLYDNVTVTELP